MSETEIGTRVHVFSADQSEDLGFGTYCGEVIAKGVGCTSPKIELDNGKIIYGYECWWSPIVD